MSKKLMVQWLAEWLIKHGIEYIKLEKMGMFDIATFQKAVRLGYIEFKSFSQYITDEARLTNKGIQYLKENDK